MYLSKNKRHPLLSVTLLLGSMLLVSSNVFAKEVAVDGFTLHMQFSPAVCMLEPQKMTSLRQCKEGYLLTVSSLQPEVSNQNSHNAKYTVNESLVDVIGNDNCSQSQAQLSPLQEKILSRVMPDPSVRNTAWRQNGACTSMQPKQYFRLIGSFMGEFTVPRTLKTGNEYQVKKQDFIRSLMRVNRALNNNQFNIMCRKKNNSQSYVLTDLQVCYDNKGKYSNCKQDMSNSCPNQFRIIGLP